MDVFDMREMFADIAKNDNIYGECCGTKMLIDDEGEFLVCAICNALIEYRAELMEAAESQGTQHTSDGIRFGEHKKKTKAEYIQDLIQEFKIIIEKNTGSQVEIEALAIACELMYEICKDNHKKRENRPQVLAACLIYASKQLGFCWTYKEVVKMLNLETKGISTGNSIFTKYIIKTGSEKVLESISSIQTDRTEIVLDEMNYENIIFRKLNCLVYCIGGKKVTIDTKENCRFCCRLIEFMLENNIAYNTLITTKIAGVIFYLVNYRGYKPAYKKKDISKALNIGQHTMMNIYNLLITPEIQHLINISPY